MSWQQVVLWVVFGLCVDGCVIAWRLTDPAFDAQVRRGDDAEQRAEWHRAHAERLDRERRLLRHQVLAAGLTPVTDKPAKQPEATS